MEHSLSEATSLWNRVLKEIEIKLDDKLVFDSFFAETYVSEISGNTIVVVASSPLAVQLLSTKFKEEVDSVVKKITQSNFSLIYVLEDDLKSKPILEEKPQFFQHAKIDPNYNFNNFVTGDSNRESYQASLMVAKNPGTLYNPLLIYGSSGLGKTHLLHSIGNYIKANRPNLKVLYTTAEDFFNEFIKYVKTQDADLKSYFRDNVDVLLVDDIQFLGGKEKTEEIFFTIFNSMYQSNKQIVITSDQHPNNLRGLNERLKTRFTSGLPISVNKPDIATCESILKSKIEANGYPLDKFDDEAITYFAKKFGSNVRELEGALNRLFFYTINYDTKDHIDLETAMNAVSDLTSSKEERNKISVDRVIREVADYYKMPTYRLTGKTRIAQVVLARHIAMYLCSKVLNIKLTKIAEEFGGKDHTSVLYAVDKIEEDVKNNPETAKVIAELTEKLKN